MSALLDTVLETIRQRRDAIEAEFGVRLTGVVGSVARGEERPDSDIDLTYEVTGYTTLFRLSRAMSELEDLLGRPVDLVDLSAVRPEARDWFEEDLILA